MFEGSLVESRGVAISQTQRWAALGSLTLQCAMAGLLMAFPLLRPQMLPMLSPAPRIALPFVSRPPAEPVRVSAAAMPSRSVSLPASAPVQTTATRPLIFQHGGEATDGPAPPIGTNLHMDGGTGPAMLTEASNGPAGAVVPVVREGATKSQRVSEGVSQGMLLTPIQPVYPQIARVTRTQGAVVLEATISKTGRIESLHMVSGSPMLQQAARDAVQRARYRPYLLNGEAVDVQTTITVVFQLGN